MAQQGTPSHIDRKVLPGAEKYYSRQQSLYDPAVLKQLTIEPHKEPGYDKVHVFKIEKVQDFTPNCRMYNNEFKRTRVAQGSHARGNHYFRWVRDDQVVIANNIIESLDDDAAAVVAAAGVPVASDAAPSSAAPADAASASASASASLPTPRTALAFLQAGPRQHIPWADGEVRAAIVTCGGLCPGLNNVVQELFYSLHYNYGVDTVYGIRSGYRGFWQSEFQPWLRLTPEIVRGIHELGGSVLGSSRGGFDVTKIVNALEVYGINQVYIIGGDGTHRGGMEILAEARRRNLKLTVACIPKTIDNDVGIIDRSFGFDTAVAEARKAVNSVVLEAQCTRNGVGIVKLMGRHAGYIAAHATLASRQVDVCLIPEVPFHLHGAHGLLPHLERVLKAQSSAVIVVAEGAGEQVMARAAAAAGAGGEIQRDASGNVKLGDIGHFLSDAVNGYFAKRGRSVAVKYVDPSYMIRSVPADAEDAVYCHFLASHAVHGAMAGLTGFSVGLVTGRTVYLPLLAVVKASPSYMNPRGSTWERILSMTHQPNWGDPEVREEADADARADVGVAKL
jgi:6-phosphofructokinase 1